MKLFRYLIAGLILAALVVALLMVLVTFIGPVGVGGMILSAALGYLFGLAILIGWCGLLWRYLNT
jgi:hypothetical protein